jgi:hypothetical protein
MSLTKTEYNSVAHSVTQQSQWLPQRHLKACDYQTSPSAVGNGLVITWCLTTIRAPTTYTYTLKHAHTWRSARADLCLKVNTQKQCCDLLGKKWGRLPMEVGQDSHTYHSSFLGFQWLHDNSSNSRAHRHQKCYGWYVRTPYWSSCSYSFHCMTFLERYEQTFIHHRQSTGNRPKKWLQPNLGWWTTEFMGVT